MAGCKSRVEVSGVGLGFRRDLAGKLLERDSSQPNFVEFAPENWLNLGGHWGKVFRAVTERYPVTCHGLSLSLGSPDPLDWEFLKRLKQMFKEVPVAVFSEHLSYTKCDNAHLFDLLPIPFRSDAVKHVAARIRQVQDFLERPIAIENVSYYSALAPEMDEATFIRSVVEESNCQLLLDVNNVYVNAFNHRYDAKAFISQLPLERVACIHMAGHQKRSNELIIDTHGEPIIDEVFELFEWTAGLVNPVPVLLERDFNLGDYRQIQGEITQLQQIVQNKWGLQHAA